MTTDWVQWHADYDDPGSSLTRRLVVVQRFLRDALAEVPADRPIRLLSLCAGDGRDVLPVLAEQPHRVRALLVELDARLAGAARVTADRLGLAGVEVRAADAGTTGSYGDHLPVRVLLACGVFGNIAPESTRRTIAALPAWLEDDGVVIWTRGRGDAGFDAGAQVRQWFVEEGFAELGYVAPDDARFRVGMSRRRAIPPVEVPPATRMFEFAR
ncbi:MAG TPA: hypothetical protein VFH38_06860 [Jatrophihabitans sp.]|nr:hypothetical protein [Jatrophihabitans sp.]